MDENAAVVAAEGSSDRAVLRIDGVDVVSFTAVVADLRRDYPHLPAARIESVVLREWEAFTAGRPLVVPTAVESGVREILDQP